MLVAGWLGLTVEQRLGRHEHAWRAVAALRRAKLGKGVLQRVRRGAAGQAFDGQDRGGRLVLDGQDQARKQRFAIDQDRAGATFAQLAAVFGAGQVEVFAQDFEQGLVDRDEDVEVLAVDVQRQGKALRARHGLLLRVWPTQRRIVRRTRKTDDRIRRPAAGPRLVPAVDRAARLLEVLESAGRGMTISELARELGINKGTMRDLLETLRAHGLLERDEERKLYRLGPRLARLGMAALGQMDLAQVAHAYLIDLAHQIGVAVLLVVRDGDRATIVDKADAGQVAVEVSATVGRRIPLAAGACGKVFLSSIEPGEVRPPPGGAATHRAHDSRYGRRISPSSSTCAGWATQPTTRST